jgi:hypothetical protein
MSRQKVAALVCEGQTDVPILTEVLSELWPDIDVRVLQPELDETDRVARGGRAGWSEVKSWCEQNREDLDDVLDPLVGDPIDLLLLAVDMDIALEAKIADPPQKVGAYESPRLRATVESWLMAQKSKVPAQIMVSTPVLAIEAWVVAALFPRERSPERVPDPARFLVKKRKLRESPKDGSPWKELHRYRDFAAQIARRLDRVRKTCPEADRTCDEIEVRRDRPGAHS